MAVKKRKVTARKRKIVVPKETVYQDVPAETPIAPEPITVHYPDVEAYQSPAPKLSLWKRFKIWL